MSHTGFHSPSRADWFASRALLASRRLRPFAPIGLTIVGLVFGTVHLVRGPLADRAAAKQRAAVRTLDTHSLAVELRSAQLTLAGRDSALRAQQYQAEARAAVPVLPFESQHTRDSLRVLLVQLESALDRASKAPLSTSYRGLANTRAMRTTEGVQALLDTLDLLDRVRLTLDPVAAPQREFAQLSERANVIGATLQALGRARRAILVQQISSVEGGGRVVDRGAAPSADTTRTRAMRDSSRLVVMRAESLLRDATQRNAISRGRADSTARAQSGRIFGASPTVAAVAALVILWVVAFSLAVAAEARRPTIAHAREAERLTGVPVLGTAQRRHMPVEGRARLQPAIGIDPFRMVYLALTASGTRERTVCIAGDDPDSVAVVAGRLAVSAASDEHATLAVDLASGTPSISRYFGERAEPGFSEAVAAVRLWREVARPVGASEGLGLDVVPAGASRSDTTESVQLSSNREEFGLFASEYDFAVIATPTSASLSIAMLLCRQPPTILVARIAVTTHGALLARIADLRRQDVSIHGILLLDDRTRSGLLAL